MASAPGTATRLAYGLGAAAYGVKDNGFSYLLLLYYNQVLGLPQQSVGLVLLVALVVDGIGDPVVGHLSDHLHSRWGRRHPFMYASALPVAASYALLWCPPQGLSEGALLGWLLAWSVTVRTLITFYEIPSSSLVAELSTDYDQRTSMLALRYFCGWWGGLTMAVLAFTVFLRPDEAHPDGVLNPAGYRTYGVVASVVIAAAILVSALGTHHRIPDLMPPPPRQPPDPRRALRELRETLSNRSFLALFAGSVFAAMAAGLSSALNVYVNTWFWGLSGDEIGALNLGYFLSALLALGLAPVAARRVGKKAAAIAISLGAVALAPMSVALRLAGWFPENGSETLVPTLFVLGVVDVALFVASSILVSSMTADVVEESELATGRRSEGVFFAARGFVAKAVSGVGILLSTVLLSVVGFPRDATPGSVDPAVITRLGATYAPTVFVLYLVSVAFLGLYGISRGSHGANLGRLGRTT